MATHLTAEQFDAFTRERYARYPVPHRNLEAAGIAAIEQAAIRGFIAEMRQQFNFDPIESAGKVKSARPRVARVKSPVP